MSQPRIRAIPSKRLRRLIPFPLLCVPRWILQLAVSSKDRAALFRDARDIREPRRFELAG
ncbi:hypothetical protein BDP27DRAFT_1324547, partial [Rhodocollybia butyracea]